MEVANTLAYYYMATITDVKSFIVQAPEAERAPSSDIGIGPSNNPLLYCMSCAGKACNNNFLISILKQEQFRILLKCTDHVMIYYDFLPWDVLAIEEQILIKKLPMEIKIMDS